MKLGPLVLSDGYLAIEPSATVSDIEPAACDIFLMQRNINWWVGDLITFGEARFGDEIWQAIPEYASVSHINRTAAQTRKYKPTDRVPAASWTQHTMVASMGTSVRRALLVKAATDRMNTAEFTEFLKNVAKG